MNVLAIVALWKIFTKAGEEGWKAIIPFYSGYILYKICWKTKMFWITMGCLFGGVVLGMICMVSESPILISLGALAMMAGVIAGLVLSIISSVKLAKAFGKSGGFAVGLILLGTIFQCILAFDNSIQYVGPQD